MSSRPSVTWAAATLAVAVLVMLFVPLPRGPFSVTHGPATALRSRRAAARTFAAIELEPADPLRPPLPARARTASPPAALRFTLWSAPANRASDSSPLRC